MTPPNASHLHSHPSLTEPALCAHLNEAHGWNRPRILNATYFQKLVAHQREHRKAEMQVAS